MSLPGTTAERATLRDRLPGTWARVEAAADMWKLGVGVLREAVRPPFSWLPDAIVEASTIFRRCALPLIFAVSIFLAANGVYTLGRLIQNLGAPDRQASGIFVASSREISTWLTMMIVAGVGGSAMTADIAARKIREELDAMSVLGVKVVSKLMVPRVMAMTFCAAIFSLISTLVLVIVNFVLVPAAYGLEPKNLQDAIYRAMLPADIYASTLKLAILGFVTGVICCSKGWTAKGGSEGVGRAVTQAVIISYFVVWMFNSIYNTAYLSLFPNVSVLRG